jgi:(2Fe-2S) ferredoxin
MLLLLLIFLTSSLISTTSALSSIPSTNTNNKKASAIPAAGTEIRICHDRDCLTDGAVEAKALVETLVKSSSNSAKAKTPVTVTTCGCLGPCGKGPSVDIRIDGVRVKDKRVGQSNYYCFRQIDNAGAAADMLEQAGLVVPEKVVEKVSSNSEPISSTRKFLDFDRTTRIALQRLLYITVLLPLVDADQNGTWDQINGVVYPNSYAAIVAIVFIGSQFMGTGSKANSINAE